MIDNYRLKELVHNHEILIDMVEELTEKIEYLNNACEEIETQIEDIAYLFQCSNVRIDSK